MPNIGPGGTCVELALAPILEVTVRFKSIGVQHSRTTTTTMADVEGPGKKKARIKEYREYDKILHTLDYNDRHDLSSHLLNAAKHKAKHPKSPKKRKRKNTSDFVIHDSWTSWPLPSNLVQPPKPVPSSSSPSSPIERGSSALHAELEAAILQIARSRIQSTHPSRVSANEHPPYHVTREISNHVISRLNRLLHALGRVKHQHLNAESAKNRQLKSKWDEIVGIAGISGCIDSSDTMSRIIKRCNSLFDAHMTFEMEN